MSLDGLNWWTLNVDGASRQTWYGIGLQLKSLAGEKIEQAIRFGFSASNNESEYEAILAEIEFAAVVSVGKLLIPSDSQSVVGQVNVEYESRDPRMAKYVSLVKQRLGCFSAWKLEHIPRACNEKANALAAVAASFPTTEIVFLPIYYQSDSPITSARVSQVDEVSPSWMDPIVYYINTGELPSERDKAHKIQVQSAMFSLVNGQLFKQSLNGQLFKRSLDGQLFKRSLDEPYLKCLTTEQGQYVLAELHEGICGNHPGDITLAHRAHTQGYYWPTMRSNAADYVRKCDQCQRLAPVLRSPT